MLERMTRDARKARSTPGFARWLRIAKEPESEDHDGSESASERPWTLSRVGSWTSIIMVIERTEGTGGGRKSEGKTWVTREYQ